MNKYELTSEFKIFLGRKLFRIRALISFGNVEAGDMGGYIEKEENLSQDGNAWVCGDARVYGNAWVCGDAEVCGNAWVCGDAEVCGDADILTITGLGSVHRTTNAFRTEKEVMISCGCFYGNIEKFRKQVKDTRKGKVQEEYLKFAELIEVYFGLKQEEEENE